MPSWNIHTAHVERLLANRDPESLGIGDVNAFLFGNYVPDIYVGFMVPDASFHVDYCLTHYASVNAIPVPEAHRYWDDNIRYRRPSSATGASLALGAWAHLLTDSVYNARVRVFCDTHEVPAGEERRVKKQADFDRFGQSLGISSIVEVTPDLLEAAGRFCSYSIQPDDVVKAVDVASAITRAGASKDDGEYQLLGSEWMTATFEECDEKLAAWLETWQRLERRGAGISAAEIRAALDA